MAAATELLSRAGDVQMGQEGRKFERVNFTFHSTDATSTIHTKCRLVQHVFLTWAAAPASDEIPYWGDTLSTDEQTFKTSDTDPVLTIGRTGASKTSALACQALIIGW